MKAKTWFIITTIFSILDITAALGVFVTVFITNRDKFFELSNFGLASFMLVFGVIALIWSLRQIKHLALK